MSSVFFDTSVHFDEHPCCCCWWRVSSSGPRPLSALPRRLPVYVMTLDVYERERRDPSLLLPPSERSLVLPRDRFTAQSRFIDPAAAHSAKVRRDYRRGKYPHINALNPLEAARREMAYLPSQKRASKEEYSSPLTLTGAAIEAAATMMRVNVRRD